MIANRALVLGAGGEFGTLLGGLLAVSAGEVWGVDPTWPEEPSASEDQPFHRQVRGDATNPNPEVLGLLRAADLIIAALPGALVPDAVRVAAAEAPAHALVLDVASVKSAVVRAMNQAQGECELLSIHPMFRASAGFRDSNVAVVRVPRSGERATEFERWLGSLGARTVQVTADQHDRTMACVQAATHAAILVFAQTLERLEYDVGLGVRLASPAHRVLLGLVARILDGSPNVYYEIQRDNPLAGAARVALADAASQLERELSGPESRDAFFSLVEQSRDMLAGESSGLADYAASLFAVPFARDDASPTD